MQEKSSSPWINVLQAGVIGGIIAVYVCMVGMVVSFDKREIIAGVLRMGATTLIMTIAVISYTAVRKSRATNYPQQIFSGVLAGLTSCAFLAGLVLLGQVVNLRKVFVNVSPALYKIITFNQTSNITAVFYLLGCGILIGSIAALVYILPVLIKKAVIRGLLMVILIGLLQELIRVTLVPFPAITRALAWMFGSEGQEGLSVSGAIVVFLVASGLNYLQAARGNVLRKRIEAMPVATQKTIRWTGWAIVFAALLIWPRIGGTYLSDVTNTVGLSMLLGLGLNIVVGFAGLLDLGYVAFYAIGAYTMAVLTTTGGEISTHLKLTFWEALPVSVIIAVLAGVILGIPVLKIRGDYLAIVTLGFGEIIRILFLSDFLKPHLGGSLGIVLVANPIIGSTVLNTPQTLYYLILAALLLVLFISWRLRDSRIGRAWKAIREDEDVAQAMGINLTTTKLMAFATGAAFGGLSGAILAARLSTVYPSSFVLLVSINVLSLIIVGGMGSLPGVMVGALILVGMPELLREFSEYRLLIYGALLIVMMLNKPEGFLPETIHLRELHETEPGEIAEVKA